MKLLIIKYLVTAFLIILVSEIARRTEKLGAFLGALPLVAIGVLIWMYLEQQGSEKLVSYSRLTFWYVIPTLPMFLVMPWLLNRLAFWPALGLGCLLTCVTFGLTVLAARLFHIDLI